MISLPKPYPQAISNPGAGEARCDRLLEISNLALYRKNGFRITGLAVDATPKQISKHGDKLKMMEEIGYGQSANTNAFPLPMPPSVDDIREALQRLKDPESRIIDEFFWFWPEAFGQSGQDEAIQAYVKGDGERAFDLWNERKAYPEKAAVACHNLGVVNHLMALEWTHHYLDTPPDSTAEKQINAYWEYAVEYWTLAMGDSNVWEIVNNRIRSLDDARLTNEFAQRMRHTLPESLGTISGGIAYRFAEQERISEAEAQLGYLRRCSTSSVQRNAIYGGALEPLRNKLAEGLKPVKTEAAEPEARFAAAKTAVMKAPAISRFFDLFYGKTSPYNTELFDDMAVACTDACVAYFLKSGDIDGTLAVLREALLYTTSETARKRVQENIDGCEMRLPPEIRLAEIKSNVLPKVLEAVQKDGANPTVMSKALLDSVATRLQAIASAAHKKYNLAVASEAMDLALKYVQTLQLKSTLYKEKAGFEKLIAEEARKKVHLKIWHDVVEVTREHVRYGRRVISAQDASAIRYGIFRRPRMGMLQPKFSCLIEVYSSKGNRIVIECKRLFRTETKSQQDFEAITQGLFANAIAANVALKTARQIMSTGYRLGKSLMTAEGMKLPRRHFFWTKEHLVPYSQIRYGFHQGILTVMKEGDTSISRKFPIRNIWNAIIFEQLLKTINALKSQAKKL